jgi:ABC-type bacteriocin/lantibiotic exporter with double-glycine peptidase domain
MSNNKIIPNALNSLFVGVILSIIFFAFYNLFNGFGGKMGFMALISIIIYFGLTNLWKDIFKNKKIKAYFL